MEKNVFVVVCEINGKVLGLDDRSFMVNGREFTDEAEANKFADKLIFYKVTANDGNTKEIMPLYKSVRVEEKIKE